MQAAVATVTKRRIILMLFTEHLRKRRPLAEVWVCLRFSFRLVWHRASCQFQLWRPAFSLRPSFLFPSGLSFLFREQGGRRYRACDRSTRGHRSAFVERRH